MGLEDIENEELKKLVEDAEKFGWTAEYENGILEMKSNSKTPQYDIQGVKISKGSINSNGKEIKGWTILFDGPHENEIIPFGKLNYNDLLLFSNKRGR